MLLPLKDINPTERTPVVTISLIAINLLVFAYEVMLGRDLQGFITSFGAVPYELTHLTDLVGNYRGSPMTHTPGPPIIGLTLITSMFLHGGVMHILGNMLYLWIFGNNIEDLLGPAKFLLFYLGCGIAAGLVHVLSGPNSTIPTVGASGAVAGVLGAYMIAYPRAKVITLVFVFIFIRLIALPAKFVLLFWFVIQAFQGVASLGSGMIGGVAWFAHIGGFVVGLLGVKLVAREQLARLKQAQEWDNFYDGRG